MSILLARDGRGTARLFHALADKTRLRILEQLADGEQCVCDLMGALEAGQSRLSFHLRRDIPRPVVHEVDRTA